MENKIALIGTGGTIAGQGASDTDLTGYTAGVLGLDEILASVPGTEPYGPYTYIQFHFPMNSFIILTAYYSCLSLCALSLILKRE